MRLVATGVQVAFDPLQQLGWTMGILLHPLAECLGGQLEAVEYVLQLLALNPVPEAGQHQLQLQQLLPALEHHAPILRQSGALLPLELNILVINHLKVERLTVVNVCEMLDGYQEAEFYYGEVPNEQLA